MGGNVKVKSILGKGSEFSVQLSTDILASKTDRKTDKGKKEKATPGKSSSRKVLVAEDDESNFVFLSELLKPYKVEIFHATTGEQVLELVEKNPDVSIVLMDIKMPGMNGLEATKAIKSKYPDIPVIAQTAYAFANDKDRALEAGCDNYVTKPIAKDVLVDILKHYIELDL
jgi:CheY-like chemotaxis protein